MGVQPPPGTGVARPQATWPGQVVRIALQAFTSPQGSGQLSRRTLQVCSSGTSGKAISARRTTSVLHVSRGRPLRHALADALAQFLTGREATVREWEREAAGHLARAGVENPGAGFHVSVRVGTGAQDGVAVVLFRGGGRGRPDPCLHVGLAVVADLPFRLALADPLAQDLAVRAAAGGAEREGQSEGQREVQAGLHEAAEDRPNPPRGQARPGARPIRAFRPRPAPRWRSRAGRCR